MLSFTDKSVLIIINSSYIVLKFHTNSYRNNSRKVHAPKKLISSF